METITTEAKLTPKLLEELENIIEEGWYTDRSDDGTIKDSVRNLTIGRRLSKEGRNIIKDVLWGLSG
jgi:Arc/MetJ-type ribon-helix-helix transcriptional regulator